MDYNFDEEVSVILTAIHQCQEMLLGRETDTSVVLTRVESIISFILDSDYSQDNKIQEVLRILEHVAHILENGVNCRRGRPRRDIPSCQLEFLLGLKFTATKIAEMFGVSRETIHQRLKEYNLSVNQTYTEIEDSSLQSSITTILLSHPNTGYKTMKGYLIAQNIRVTEYRIRENMRLVDPLGVYQRTIQRNRQIRRRIYFVKYSNELWHIDGNLKLIRWGFVIRAGIDGKSRTVTYIGATCDNRADTHFSSFLTGVQTYGVPVRTRSDKGGENVLIAKFMLEQRGLGRGSHICGRSVHNQRIERFWRDVFNGCTSFYRTLFEQLEVDGLLDIDNEIHIFVLHYIFLPRLNRQLAEYIQAWNNHSLSTEGNYSPNQLMIMNLPPPDYDLNLTSIDLAPDDLEVEDLSGFSAGDTITQPSFLTPSLTTEQETILEGIDPLAESTSFGYDMFCEVIQHFN